MRTHHPNENDKRLLGWREWVRLDGLGLPPIKAKIDTGARSSALHAFGEEIFELDGRQWVRFNINPRQRDSQLFQVESPVIDYRYVTNSGGHRQKRYVIETLVTLGDDSWPIELTLTSRETMRFRLLLGRTALQGRYTVDPDLSYCIGKKPRKNIANVTTDNSSENSR